jgi:hypothetical protein
MDRRFPGLREWLQVALMAHDTFQSAELADIDAMARLRAEGWGSIPYWQARIRSYMSGELNPQHALPPRILITAKEGTDLIGFIAGHLSRRFDWQGELERARANVIERRATAEQQGQSERQAQPGPTM